MFQIIQVLFYLLSVKCLITRTVIVENIGKRDIIQDKDIPLCILWGKYGKLENLTDDFENLRSFCSCVIVQANIALTAKSCMVQKEWKLYTVEDIQRNLSREYQINITVDSEELTIIYLNKEIKNVQNVNLPVKNLSKKDIESCYLYSFINYQNKQIIFENESSDIEKFWTITNILIELPVKVDLYSDSKCRNRHNLKKISRTFANFKTILCVLPMQTNFDLCASDLGAPILCNGKLVGLITTMVNRPPHGVLDNSTDVRIIYAPNSCFTDFNNSNYFQNYIYLADRIEASLFINEASSESRILINFRKLLPFCITYLLIYGF